jgi:hypothetical protein
MVGGFQPVRDVPRSRAAQNLGFLRFWILDLRFEILELGFGIWDLKFGI